MRFELPSFDAKQHRRTRKESRIREKSGYEKMRAVDLLSSAFLSAALHGRIPAEAACHGLPSLFSLFLSFSPSFVRTCERKHLVVTNTRSTHPISPLLGRAPDGTVLSYCAGGVCRIRINTVDYLLSGEYAPNSNVLMCVSEITHPQPFSLRDILRGPFPPCDPAAGEVCMNQKRRSYPL